MIARLAALALIVALALVATLQASPSVEARSNILWRDCFDTFECGAMKVPLKHDEPARGDIEIALIRAPALDQENRIGSLLVNFGGPGGPGVEGVLFGVGQFPFELRERFDIIGFDPRGVGQSAAIDCIDSFSEFTSDPSPDTSHEISEAIDEAQAFGEDCRRRSAKLIQYVNSESVARDMDLIREEVGDEKMTYIGFSYGTFLGATYAQYFPDKIRAVLLDAAMDPAATPEEDIVQQAFGFERALDSFFSDCAADPNCPFQAPDLEAAFDQLLIDAEAAPLPGWAFPITADDILNATSGALYNREFAWLTLAEAMRQAVDEGSGVGFGVLTSGIDTGDDENVDFTNGYEAFIAVACVDFWSFRNEQEWRGALEQARATAPHFGAGAAFTALPCINWPNAERRVPGPYTAAGAPPIVVIGGLRDPATPYEWSEAMASQLESGVLVTYDGDGHVALGKNTCVDDIGVRYLVDLDVPADGAFCDNEYEAYPGSAAPEPAAPAPPAGGAAPTGVIFPPDTGSGGQLNAHGQGTLAVSAAWLLLSGIGLVLGARRGG